VLAVRDVGKKYHVPVVDLWTALKGESSERALYLVDGLHLNEIGNRMVYQEVMKAIGIHFFELQNLQLDQPHWSSAIHS
jgi:lysophospholipase L1-like esterase